jgi:hypothetical protein
MSIDIDPDLERLRELCRPGALPCAWNTAFYRCFVHDLVVGVTGDEGSHVGTETIRAEFRALLAENPDLSVCPEHIGELATAREAMGQAPPPPP